MELDVSRGFIHPATPFPFEASLTLEAQDVGGETVTFDPVALDQACADACNAAAPLAGSLLDEHMHDAHFHDHHDHFRNTTPESEWQTCLEHAEKIGVGTRAYELIRI